MQGDAIAISCSGQLHGGSIQGPIQRWALAWDSTRTEKEFLSRAVHSVRLHTNRA